MKPNYLLLLLSVLCGLFTAGVVYKVAAASLIGGLWLTGLYCVLIVASLALISLTMALWGANRPR